MEVAKDRPELLLPPHALPADHPLYKPAPARKKQVEETVNEPDPLAIQD
jgi:hypothetical protein